MARKPATPKPPPAPLTASPIEPHSERGRNAVRDEALKRAAFFNDGKATTARYTASRFSTLGNGRYRADGQLTLRGISRPVALVFSWKPGKSAVLSGEATVNRLDYRVGSGDWSDTGILPNAVKVKTVLVLVPKTPTKP